MGLGPKKAIKEDQKTIKKVKKTIPKTQKWGGAGRGAAAGRKPHFCAFWDGFEPFLIVLWSSLIVFWSPGVHFIDFLISNVIF